MAAVESNLLSLAKGEGPSAMQESISSPEDENKSISPGRFVITSEGLKCRAP